MTTYDCDCTDPKRAPATPALDQVGEYHFYDCPNFHPVVVVSRCDDCQAANGIHYFDCSVHPGRQKTVADPLEAMCAAERTYREKLDAVLAEDDSDWIYSDVGEGVTHVPDVPRR